MIHFTKWLAPVGFKGRKRSDQKFVVIPEYKMIATIAGKNKNYRRVKNNTNRIGAQARHQAK